MCFMMLETSWTETELLTLFNRKLLCETRGVMTVNILMQGVSEILKGLELNFQGVLLGFHSTRGW